MVHKRFRVFDRTLDGVTVVRSFFFLVIRFGCYGIYSYSMYMDTKPIFRATVFCFWSLVISVAFKNSESAKNKLSYTGILYWMLISSALLRNFSLFSVIITSLLMSSIIFLYNSSAWSSVIFRCNVRYFHITLAVSMMRISTAYIVWPGLRYLATFSQFSSLIKSFENADESMTITVFPQQFLCGPFRCGWERLD